ncbi:unnamed protein product, partial [Meganyctiphanes norvegica]
PFKIEGSVLEFIIFFDEQRNWFNAKRKCEAESMLTAHPSDKVAIKLRKHLLESCGDVPVWLNAKSDGTKFVWLDNNAELNRDDNLWLIGDPTSIFDQLWHYLDERISIYHCLNLAVLFDNWSERPRRVYASKLCSFPYFYTLCEDCPAGFVRVEGSRQCFKVLNNRAINWENGQQECLNENLVLASPHDNIAVALRQLILDKYGDEGPLWLDGVIEADYTGQLVMVWQRHQRELDWDSSLWLPGARRELRSNKDSLACLHMWPKQSDVTAYPTQPYSTRRCKFPGKTLCE